MSLMGRILRAPLNERDERASFMRVLTSARTTPYGQLEAVLVERDTRSYRSRLAEFGGPSLRTAYATIPKYFTTFNTRS